MVLIVFAIMPILCIFAAFNNSNYDLNVLIMKKSCSFSKRQVVDLFWCVNSRIMTIDEIFMGFTFTSLPESTRVALVDEYSRLKRLLLKLDGIISRYDS